MNGFPRPMAASTRASRAGACPRVPPVSRLRPPSAPRQTRRRKYRRLSTGILKASLRLSCARCPSLLLQRPHPLRRAPLVQILLRLARREDHVVDRLLPLRPLGHQVELHHHFPLPRPVDALVGLPALPVLVDLREVEHHVEGGEVQ